MRTVSKTEFYEIIISSYQRRIFSWNNRYMKSEWKNGRRSFRIATPAVLQKKNGVCKIILMKNRFITGNVWYGKKHLQNTRCHNQTFRQHLWNFRLQSFLLKLLWMILLPLSAWLVGLRLRSQRQLRLYLSGNWSRRCPMLNDASKRPPKSKVWSGKEMFFCFCTRDWMPTRFHGQGTRKRPFRSPRNSTGFWWRALTWLLNGQSAKHIRGILCRFVQKVENKKQQDTLWVKHPGSYPQICYRYKILSPTVIDTIEGAKASAIIYSITEMVKVNGLNPFRYMEYRLTELMEHLDDTERSFLDDFLPWSKTLPDICWNSQQKQ